jgi:hypothetical protein
VIPSVKVQSDTPSNTFTLQSTAQTAAPPSRFPFGGTRGRLYHDGHHGDIRPGRSAGNTLVPERWSSTFSLDRDSQKSENGSGFQVPSYHAKKERQKQQRIIKGKSQARHGVKGAPEPSRHLFIYRVDPDTSENDIKVLLQDNQHDLNIRELVCTSHESAMFKSFKLTVPLSDYSALFNEDIWPDGIRVRPFRNPRPFNSENTHG